MIKKLLPKEENIYETGYPILTKEENFDFALIVLREGMCNMSMSSG